VNAVDAQLTRIAQSLRSRYQDHLRQILFFGSRIRGDASAESDYDCLLIFDQVDRSIKSALERFESEWLLEQGIVLSCVAISERDLERLQYEPFLRNARREGIAA